MSSGPPRAIPARRRRSRRHRRAAAVDAAAAKTLIDKATAVEGDMTQLQGSAGQDSLNFPTRLDGQIVELYSGIVGNERKLPRGMTERYADLKDQVNPTMARVSSILGAEVAAFNAISGPAGFGTIVVK